MYIMRILKSQLMIIWSWGFNSPKTITNGLSFRVQGFKFKGTVEVVYNEGTDCLIFRSLKEIRLLRLLKVSILTNL